MSDHDPDPAFDDMDLDYEPAGENDVAVVVTCPKCGKCGKVLVDKRAIAASPGKVLNYGVVSGVVCQHAFLTGIDSRLVAR